MSADGTDDFVEAGRAEDRGLVAELLAFMTEKKAWWMAPLLIVFGVLGVIFVLGATGAAPFIYSLFG